MGKWTQEAETILQERFGKDSVIALATMEDGKPWVRNVNAFYEDGAFYVITYGLSNKMRQLAKNPEAAIAGDWFTAQGPRGGYGVFRERGKPGNGPKAAAGLCRVD